MAGEHRTYFYPVDSRFHDPLCQLVVNFHISVSNNVIVHRVLECFGKRSSEYTFLEGLDDLSSLYKGDDCNAFPCAAIFLQQDNILGNIDKPPGKVSGISGL